MLVYLRGSQLKIYKRLAREMYQDRATQFKARLGWDVSVDHNGFERDQYDRDDALYAIWIMPDGSHGGSMRTMPTDGPCMINEHFSHLAGRKIASDKIWESTRFCVSPRFREAGMEISAGLMLAGCEIGLALGLSQAVAVFDARIERIYRRIGWPPEVLGSEGQGRDRVSAGIWGFDTDTRDRLAAKAGLSPEASLFAIPGEPGFLPQIAA